MRCLCLPCPMHIMHTTSRPRPAISLAASVPSWRSFHAATAFKQAPTSINKGHTKNTARQNTTATKFPNDSWRIPCYHSPHPVRKLHTWMNIKNSVTFHVTHFLGHMCSNSHCCFSCEHPFIAFAERSDKCKHKHVVCIQPATLDTLSCPTSGPIWPSLFIVTPCQASLKPFELLSLRRRVSSLAQIPMN